MVLQREILAKAQEWGVHPNTVDKDYVLGHFLHCFFSFDNNRKCFIFKGGTCLRKCYFPDYRFSEDLDFTLTDSTFSVNEEFILKITRSCTLQTGIQFHLIKFEKKQFLNEEKGYKCVIAFWGANHSKNKAPAPKERWITKIEIDISIEEEILFPVNQLKIHHPYSDRNRVENATIPVYSMEEILTEKIRAFYQRSYKAPRDFYDVWYLLNHADFQNWEHLSNQLKVKCAVKNILIDTQLFESEQVYEIVSQSWNKSIAHHLFKEHLPDFEKVWTFLKSSLFVKYFSL